MGMLENRPVVRAACGFHCIPNVVTVSPQTGHEHRIATFVSG
jgi:hypothetical protein